LERKHLKFKLEVGGSSLEKDNSKNVSNLEIVPKWNENVNNQVIMFNSLNDFNTDIKK